MKPDEEHGCVRLATLGQHRCGGITGAGCHFPLAEVPRGTDRETLWISGIFVFLLQLPKS